MENLEVSNDHNVYILGAGFSATAGLPLMGGFLNRMRDALEAFQKEGRAGESQAIGEVLHYRHKAASAAYWTTLDLENIEQLFSLASAARHSVSLQLPTAIAGTLEFCRAQRKDGKVRVQPNEHEIEQRYRPSVGNPNPVWTRDAPKIYKLIENAACEGRMTFKVAALLGMVNSTARVSGKNTFITFNYDTLVEDALARLNVPWTYGLPRETTDFTNEKWGASDVESAIPVLKLHGSVNWGLAKDSAKRLSVFRSYHELSENGIRPRLIPPTWSKNVDEQLSAVWEGAIQRLQSATRIIIIGFSMPETDLHFRYLLAAGLQENAWLRTVIFANPDAEGVEKKARAVLKNSYIDQGLIRFAKMESETFAREIAGDRTSSGQSFEIGRAPEAKLRFWTSQR